MDQARKEELIAASGWPRFTRFMLWASDREHPLRYHLIILAIFIPIVLLAVWANSR